MDKFEVLLVCAGDGIAEELVTSNAGRRVQLEQTLAFAIISI
jgi:diacylglycerol kinase family enzyme